MSRDTRKVTKSTPTTDNNPVGVAVGVSAEEVEDIVAKVCVTWYLQRFWKTVSTRREPDVQ